MADNNLKDNQKGTVLMYTLLVISAILTTSLTVSSFLRSNIKLTASINNYETAYLAAESGAEQTLYNVRKDINVNAASTHPGSSLVYSGAVTQTGVQELIVDLPEDQTLQIELYVPEVTAAGAGVGSMNLVWDPGVKNSFLEVTRLEFPYGATIPWQVYPATNVTKVLFSGGNSTDNAFLGAKNYIVRIKSLFGPSNNLHIKLFSLDDKGGSAIPFPNFYRITETGTNGGSTVPVVVDVNRFTPAMGLFDYVLFSEEKIYK
jgi:hypothetical protein